MDSQQKFDVLKARLNNPVDKIVLSILLEGVFLIPEEMMPEGEPPPAEYHIYIPQFGIEYLGGKLIKTLEKDEE